MCSPEELLVSERGMVVAPAGCGKTHLIAQAAAAQTEGRQLILTHTHAGVEAIRGHLRSCGALSSRFTLATIAGWCLLYAASYPATSGLVSSQPRTPDEWESVYIGARHTLNDSRIAAVPTATYSGVLVDEYQDCTTSQHDVITALAALLPVRVLGDPLQGIFDFGGNEPVDWERDVETFFEPLPSLDTPWRWRQGDPDLGEWLKLTRQQLIGGAPVDLGVAPNGAVTWVEIPVDAAGKINAQRKVCYRLLSEDTGSLAAIHGLPVQCRYLARQLGGTYQCTEAVECPDLLDFSARVESADGVERAAAVVEFVCSCIAGLKTGLGSLRRSLSEGQCPQPRRYRKNLPVLEAVVQVSKSEGLEPVRELVARLMEVPDCRVFRYQLLRDFRKGLQAFLAGEGQTLTSSVWSARNESRRVGRRLPYRVVGTTKLLKGLEFDTAIVLDAASLSRKDLYVALTRASRRLIILSKSPILDPDR